MAIITVVTRPGDALYLRFAHGGDTRYSSLTVSVPRRHWNDQKGRPRKSCPGREELEALCLEVEARAQRAVLQVRRQAGAVTAARIKERYDEIEGGRHKDTDLLAYGRALVGKYERAGQVQSAERYGSDLDRVARFCDEELGRAELTLRGMSGPFLRDLRDWMTGPEGYADSSAARTLKGLRMVVRRALRERVVEGPNPFDLITISEKTATKERLTRPELQKLEEAELEGYLAVARDVFLWSTYLHGMRRSDALVSRWDQLRGGRLEYRMSKTGEARSVAVGSAAGGLLKRYEHRRGEKEYVFPWLDGYPMSTPEDRHRSLDARGALLNKGLKKIMRRLGIDKHITAHCARHTFADLARKGGWTTEDIQKALGHASIKTTERYLSSIKDDALDEDTEALFS